MTLVDVRHQAFVQLAEGWGRVQASYILGDYDMNAMDYPLMVDYFHSGNEDIHESIERLVDVETQKYQPHYIKTHIKQWEPLTR